MTRSLTNIEIEDIISFIKPQEGIPLETAMSVVNFNKQKLRKQLSTQLVNPVIIPELKQQIIKSYTETIIQAGESVGVVCAQSIGERQTQNTLNSIDWSEKILYLKDAKAFVQPIGEMIDNLLEKSPDKIQHIEKNKTQYLPLPEGFFIPSCDKDGMCDWYKIEAVTKHYPVGKLVKITTQSGRSVMATQAKSFLVWNGKIFIDTLGSDIKVGDIVPTTISLEKPKDEQKYFDMSSIFPTTDLVISRKYRRLGKQGWLDHNGKEFTVPYKRPDTCFGKRKEYASNKCVSHIPDKIPLDKEFGYLIGLYLAEGLVTLTCMCITNNDPNIRKRITDFCDRYSITYHTVHKKNYNVRNGISIDLRIHSTLLARMFKIICDTGSPNKRVPEFAYTAPTEFIMGLIDGYFSGDGTVNKKNGNVSVGSVSEKLILGISFLLSYFNIFGRLSSSQPKKNNVGSKNIKRMYLLSISNGFAQKFAKEIFLTDSKKQDKLNAVTKEYRHKYGRTQENFPDRDVYFDEVVSVEYVDGTTEYVYDFTVEETRHFQIWSGLNLMDSFHKAGQVEKTVVTGVPRFQELLNATKDPKMVSSRIYFKEGYDTVQNLRKMVGHGFVELTFDSISKTIVICMDKKPEPWYDAFKILYNDDYTNYTDCISIKIDINMLYEYKLTLEKIAKVITDDYDDLTCVFSPSEIGQLDIFVDTTAITLPEKRILFINEDNAKQIYLEECVQPMISKMVICGITGIKNIYYTQDEEEWVIETDGSNYKKILSHPKVNITKTVSNNVWEIFQVLGIEAARNFLIQEYMSIMEGINICHTKLLVERMTYAGTISSISRYTMRRDDIGVLSRASFEESLDNFARAAAHGEIESTKGVSASIICSKRSSIGTGMMDLKIDILNLPGMPPVMEENIIEKPIIKPTPKTQKIVKVVERKYSERTNRKLKYIEV